MTQPAPGPAVTCAHCGEVIGVYEQMVVVDDAGPHPTSLAADPDVARGAAACFHNECHVSAQAGEPAAQAGEPAAQAGEPPAQAGEPPARHGGRLAESE